MMPKKMVNDHPFSPKSLSMKQEETDMDKQVKRDLSTLTESDSSISNFAPALPKAKATAKARVSAVATSTTITTTHKHTVKGELKPTTISTSIGLNKEADKDTPQATKEH
mmetsp:Transcript_1253/g.2605  ORF Transcript_1253/g.2605 Transcript_1253/m.2605 type:complete len:110 (+) Transcript_1253:136-465(+)